MNYTNTKFHAPVAVVREVYMIIQNMPFYCRVARCALRGLHLSSNFDVSISNAQGPAKHKTHSDATISTSSMHRTIEVGRDG